MKNYKNVVYILINPLYAGYVKIGYASDLNQRLSSLNTGMLRNFEPYAVYETPQKNADKQFHAIIDDLAPIVRARVINGQKVQDKEFFKLEPEQAYEILHHIAVLTGTEKNLHLGADEAVSPGMPLASPYQQQTPVHASMSKPVSYTINGKTRPFTSWIHALEDYCETVVSTVGFSTFRSAVVGMKMGDSKASKRNIFDDKPDDMKQFGFYKFPEGELYLLTNYSAQGIQTICGKIHELFPNVSISFEY